MRRITCYFEHVKQPKVDYLVRTVGLGHNDSLGKPLMCFFLHFLLFTSEHKVVSVVTGAQAVAVSSCGRAGRCVY